LAAASAAVVDLAAEEAQAVVDLAVSAGAVSAAAEPEEAGRVSSLMKGLAQSRPEEKSTV
jgi:hypothetical protein